tara:strand:+ start:741 stop:1550 length:810 start_codon:yes stop_codon:yes gene_type:complete
MKKIFLLFSLLTIFSCSKEDNQDEKESNELGDFSSYIDVKSLRIFAKESVSESFLNNVAKTYELMFEDGSIIDESMRSHYFATSKSNYVYQRVGVFAEDDPNFNPGTPPSPYDDNVTDYIWEINEKGEEQIGEVLEHLLHTVTNVIFYLAYPNEWDFDNTSSLLNEAMNESIEKGIYDISSYNEIKNDNEIYNKILTQEYAYWLILAEWNYFIMAGKKMEGISGNEEFTIGTSSEIASQLPLGHKLYKEYIEKILSIPDPGTIKLLFPN